MADIRLLAIVEVPKNDRVVCQAQGCGHSVYKRIHVVQSDGVITVLGSECFKKLFGESLTVPNYGGAEGRLLTQEERLLLIENTARLIEQFEAERQAALDAIASQQHALPFPPSPDPIPRRLSVHAAELQVKQELRDTMGINPELPGWQGLVQLKIRELLR
jgi:hypothetical protein